MHACTYTYKYIYIRCIQANWDTFCHWDDWGKMSQLTWIHHAIYFVYLNLTETRLHTAT